MLELRNLEELVLFINTVGDAIPYEYKPDGFDGYEVAVTREYLKVCVDLFTELMEQTDKDDINPWDNKEYLLAMRLYDEAYYDMCYGDGKLADAYNEE